MPHEENSISTKFTEDLHKQNHHHHYHHQHQQQHNYSNLHKIVDTQNVPEQQQNAKNGQFKKIANKVIEWIRKSLVLGKNEVVYLFSL